MTTERREDRRAEQCPTCKELRPLFSSQRMTAFMSSIGVLAATRPDSIAMIETLARGLSGRREPAQVSASDTNGL